MKACLHCKLDESMYVDSVILFNAYRYHDVSWYTQRRRLLLAMVRISISIFAGFILLDCNNLVAPFMSAKRKMCFPVYAVCLISRSIFMKVDIVSNVSLQLLDCIIMGAAFRQSGFPGLFQSIPALVFWSCMVTVYVITPSILSYFLESYIKMRSGGGSGGSAAANSAGDEALPAAVASAAAKVREKVQ